MFRFANIEFLWGLTVIPLIILLFVIIRIWKRRTLKKYGDKPVISTLMPHASTAKPIIKLILFCIGYIFLIIALTNPQIGSKMEEVKREGVDIVIALDVSNSMNAEDISPSRLEAAKRAISQLIDRLHNDRIGIIVFGGEAYIQLPVTTDFSAAKLFLSTINTNIVPTQGTAIGASIDLAMRSFDFEHNSSKAIIIITDGENHEDDAVAAAENALEKDVRVHTIGMGSLQGTPIPIMRKGQLLGYRKDKEGNTIVTKLNETMLQQIASAGNGSYVRATNAQSGLKMIQEEINKMQKVEFGSKVYTDYDDQFQYFLGLALFFFLMELLVSERKSRWLEKINLFETAVSDK